MSRTVAITFLVAVALLACLGILMLASTGGYAKDLPRNASVYYFAQSQGVYLALGLLLAVVAGVIDYEFWTRRIFHVPLWACLMAGAFVALLLCLVPGIGVTINGSSRWVKLPGLPQFQPSELAKVASVFFLAWWAATFHAHVREFWRGFIFPLAAVGAFCVPILFEVDLGTTALIMAACLTVMFFAGTHWAYVGTTVVAGAAALAGVIILIPNRARRFLEFYYGEDHQQKWAEIAFGLGGIDGAGYGQGVIKMLYLPFAHTDFIFSMVGEELGLKVTVLVVLAYLTILLCGVHIALHARERFGAVLAIGCVLMLTIQATINMGVTLSLFPNKGMPLPFVSYGGTGIVVSCLMVGLVMSVYRHGRGERRGGVRI